MRILKKGIKSELKGPHISILMFFFYSMGDKEEGSYKWRCVVKLSTQNETFNA